MGSTAIDSAGQLQLHANSDRQLSIPSEQNAPCGYAFGGILSRLKHYFYQYLRGEIKVLPVRASLLSVAFLATVSIYCVIGGYVVPPRASVTFAWPRHARSSRSVGPASFPPLTLGLLYFSVDTPGKRDGHTSSGWTVHRQTARDQSSMVWNSEFAASVLLLGAAATCVVLLLLNSDRHKRRLAGAVAYSFAVSGFAFGIGSTNNEVILFGQRPWVVQRMASAVRWPFLQAIVVALIQQHRIRAEQLQQLRPNLQADAAQFHTSTAETSLEPTQQPVNNNNNNVRAAVPLPEPEIYADLVDSLLLLVSASGHVVMRLTYPYDHPLLWTALLLVWMGCWLPVFLRFWIALSASVDFDKLAASFKHCIRTFVGNHTSNGDSNGHGRPTVTDDDSRASELEGSAATLARQSRAVQAATVPKHNHCHWLSDLVALLLQPRNVVLGMCALGVSIEIILNWTTNEAWGQRLETAVVAIEVISYVLSPQLFLFGQLLKLDELQALQQKFEVLAVKAASQEAASEARKRFLRYVFHEVRVPFNAVVLGLDHLAGENELSEGGRETVAMMTSSAEAMSSIMNDVLEMSAIEAGGVKVKLEPCDLRRMLALVHHQMKPWAASAKVKLEVHADLNIPALLLAAEHRLGQVTRNLVSNALKFCPTDGSGLVSVSAALIAEAAYPQWTVQPPVATPDPARSCTGRNIDRPEDADVDYIVHECDAHGCTSFALIRIQVKDNGIGIDRSEQSKLFQPFYQIQSGRESAQTASQQESKGVGGKKIKGTGLGLAISREIVRRHGGCMGVKSGLGGEGSTFWFQAWLPVLPTSTPVLSRLQGAGELESEPETQTAVVEGGDVGLAGAHHPRSSRDVVVDTADAASVPSAHSLGFPDSTRVEHELSPSASDDAAASPSPAPASVKPPRALAPHAVADRFSAPASSGACEPRPPSSQPLAALPQCRTTSSDSSAGVGIVAGGRPTAAAAVGHATPGPPLRILIVDDVTTNRRMLMRVLQRRYPQAIYAEAANGAEAVDLVSKSLLLSGAVPFDSTEPSEPNSAGPLQFAPTASMPSQCFDVITMDKEMPVMDGFESAKRIRTLYQEFNECQSQAPAAAASHAIVASGIAAGPVSLPSPTASCERSTPRPSSLVPRPVIVGVTGNALAEDQRAFIEAGADGVVIKPVSIDALIGWIEKRVRK